MKLRVGFFVMVMAAIGIFLRNENAQAIVPQLSAQQQEAILSSTLQIAMYEHATEIGAPETGERGLGTMVAYGGETLILTHDHWAPLTANLSEVEFRDARGALMLTLDARAFRSFIAYRDGGTMVLRAPAGLEGPVVAAPGAWAVQGDVVWFARRAAVSGRTMVEVVAAAVTDVDDGGAPAGMRLRNLDGSAVIPGDSGGGVWANGKLLGNLWAAGVQEDRSLWATILGDGDDGEASDLTIAALHPLYGDSGPVSFARAPEGAEHGGGYQREP